jgi:hypothetical protein
VADEHHADWAGQKGYIPTTVGGGCILGVALTAAADDAHLQVRTDNASLTFFRQRIAYQRIA